MLLCNYSIRWSCNYPAIILQLSRNYPVRWSCNYPAIIFNDPAIILQLSCNYPVQWSCSYPAIRLTRFAAENAFRKEISAFRRKPRKPGGGGPTSLLDLFDSSAAHGVHFHDFTLENSVSQTQVREVLTRQICVFDWCRRHQSKKNTFFFTQNCCFLHFPLYNYHLVFLTFPPFFEKISGPNCLF